MYQDGSFGVDGGYGLGQVPRGGAMTMEVKYTPTQRAAMALRRRQAAARQRKVFNPQVFMAERGGGSGTVTFRGTRPVLRAPRRTTPRYTGPPRDAAPRPTTRNTGPPGRPVPDLSRPRSPVIPTTARPVGNKTLTPPAGPARKAAASVSEGPPPNYARRRMPIMYSRAPRRPSGGVKFGPTGTTGKPSERERRKPFGTLRGSMTGGGTTMLPLLAIGALVFFMAQKKGR